MTSYIPNTTFNLDQVDAARRIMQREGWEFVEDRAYPVSDPRRKGWWINPEHETKCRRTGDSLDYTYATQTTFRLYSGHSDEELTA